MGFNTSICCVQCWHPQAGLHVLSTRSNLDPHPAFTSYHSNIPVHPPATAVETIGPGLARGATFLYTILIITNYLLFLTTKRGCMVAASIIRGAFRHTPSCQKIWYPSTVGSQVVSLCVYEYRIGGSTWAASSCTGESWAFVVVSWRFLSCSVWAKRENILFRGLLCYLRVLI